MKCSECGLEAPAMPTVYWLEEGEEAEEWPLCEGCYREVASEVMIVPGVVTAWGTCERCGEWLSVRELQDARLGGKRGAWTGVCRACAG